MDKYEQYELVFNKFDVNKDGKICALELQRCVGALGNCEMTIDEAAATMEFLDGDGDGLMDFNDFVKFVEEQDGEVNGEEIGYLKEVFKFYEMEGCECITPKSLKRMLSRLGISRNIEDCIAMIHHFDLNGDGVLNFDEFRVMMM
ncbi:hypothetical protein ACFE04_008128 [Oxalis oulophora]